MLNNLWFCRDKALPCLYTTQELEQKVIAKYPVLTPQEIKSLVVESKWMDELQSRVIGEVDRLSQRLARRVKELAERYNEPLPMITDEVNELTKKVDLCS